MVTRQHAETVVVELEGLRVEELLSAGRKGDDATVDILLLRAGGRWHRMFLDAGLFFLMETAAPDPEDDLEPGADYVDCGAKYALKGDVIRSIRMADGVLRIETESGRALRLCDSDDGSRLEAEESPSPAG